MPDPPSPEAGSPSLLEGVAVCTQGDALYIVWPASEGLIVQELGDNLGPCEIALLVPWDALRERIRAETERPGPRAA